MLLDDLLLYPPWKLIPDLVRPVWTVQEEGRSIDSVLKHIITFEEDELVTCAKTPLAHQVRRTDTVRTQTVEHTAKYVLRLRREGRIVFDAALRDIVFNPNREVVLRHFLLHFVEHAFHHCRCKFLRRETVPSADDPRGTLKRRSTRSEGLRNSSYNIDVKWLTRTPRLLRSVKNCQCFHGGRESIHKTLHRKWPVQAHLHKPDFFSSRCKEFNGLVDGLSTRSHQDDNAFSVHRTDVVEKVVLTTDEPGKLVHCFLSNVWTGSIEGADSLPSLEKHIWILGRPTEHRTIR